MGQHVLEYAFLLVLVQLSILTLISDTLCFVHDKTVLDTRI